MAKNKQSNAGIVYSTNPDFVASFEKEEEQAALLPKDQKLRIRLEKKHRAGKMVTLIEGFVGSQTEKDELIKNLKAFCGTGGSSKDGEMFVQGDQREKALKWLVKCGYQGVRNQ